jgi:N-formylglutamate amidohydrolase
VPDAMTTGFDILAPARWTVPMVFNSPHSGRFLPDHFLNQSALSERQLLISTDCHVDELFAGCIEAGAPLMRALLSRAYLDLNREPFECDARMFGERLPTYVNSASPRVASGLGTIPRTVGDGLLIYSQPLDWNEALHRIENSYRPYHRALNALLDEAYQSTGLALLVDCHSMPSSAVTHLRGNTARGIDVVLGDRYGNSCDTGIVDQVETVLHAAGLKVSRNKPYAGGFFTENHGRPRLGRHALQIELRRSLYMNEQSHEKNAGFAALKDLLDQLSLHLAKWLTRHAMMAKPELAHAAE